MIDRRPQRAATRPTGDGRECATSEASPTPPGRRRALLGPLSLSLSRSLTLAGPREWPAKGSNKGNKGNKGNINNNNNNKLLKAGARELRNLEAQSNSRSSAEQSRGGQR